MGKHQHEKNIKTENTDFKSSPKLLKSNSEVSQTSQFETSEMKIKQFSGTAGQGFHL